MSQFIDHLGWILFAGTAASWWCVSRMQRRAEMEKRFEADGVRCHRRRFVPEEK